MQVTTWIFVKYLCRVGSQNLQTFQLTASLCVGCFFFKYELIVKLILGNSRVN